MTRTDRNGYHEVTWTQDQVRRFWNWSGANEAADHTYFSRRFARRIIGLAARHVRLADPVVDLGAGPGFLCDELLRRGHSVRALDASERSVARARERLSGRSGFLGAELATQGRLPLGDASVGSLFLVEVLEHLVAEAREGLLAEARRVLRPGGPLVVTTPHAEDLDEKKIACPQCGGVFHRVQHVASFTAPALRRLLAAGGFEPRLVGAVNLRHFPDRVLGPLVSFVVRRLQDPALAAPPPHLVGVAVRGAAPSP